MTNKMLLWFVFLFVCIATTEGADYPLALKSVQDEKNNPAARESQTGFVGAMVAEIKGFPVVRFDSCWYPSESDTRNAIQLADQIIECPQANYADARTAFYVKKRAIFYLEAQGLPTDSIEPSLERLRLNGFTLLVEQEEMAQWMNKSRMVFFRAEDEKAFWDLIADLDKKLPEKASDLTEPQASCVLAAIEAAMRFNNPLISENIVNKYTGLLLESGNPDWKNTALAKLGAFRFSRLEGKPFVLSGKDVSGKPFNILDYQGKTLIVRFWNYQNCLSDSFTKELKRTYGNYHAKGLEVIYIGKFHSSNLQEEIIKRYDIPWQVIDDSQTQIEGKTAWEHFGIGQKLKPDTFNIANKITVPESLIVNSQGFVSTMNLESFTLNDMIACHLGPSNEELKNPRKEYEFFLPLPEKTTPEESLELLERQRRSYGQIIDDCRRDKFQLARFVTLVSRVIESAEATEEQVRKAIDYLFKVKFIASPFNIHQLTFTERKLNIYQYLTVYGYKNIADEYQRKYIILRMEDALGRFDKADGKELYEELFGELESNLRAAGDRITPSQAEEIIVALRLLERSGRTEEFNAHLLRTVPILEAAKHPSVQQALIPLKNAFNRESLIGKPFAMTGVFTDGTAYDSADYRGRVQVIYVSPSKGTLYNKGKGGLGELKRLYENQGIALITVWTQKTAEERYVSDLIAGAAFDGMGNDSTSFHEQTLADYLGLSSLQDGFFIVVNRQGDIAAAGRSEKRVQQAVKELFAFPFQSDCCRVIEIPLRASADEYFSLLRSIKGETNLGNIYNSMGRITWQRLPEEAEIIRLSIFDKIIETKDIPDNRLRPFLFVYAQNIPQYIRTCQSMKTSPEYSAIQKANAPGMIETFTRWLNNLPDKLYAAGRTELAQEYFWSSLGAQMKIAAKENNRPRFEQLYKILQGCLDSPQQNAVIYQSAGSLYTNLECCAQAVVQFNDPVLTKQVTAYLIKRYKELEGNRAKFGLYSTIGRLRINHALGTEFCLGGNQLNGQPINMRDFKGKYVFIYVCQEGDDGTVHKKETERLVDCLRLLYEKYAESDLEIIAVSRGERLDDVKAFFEKANLPWITVMNSQTVIDNQPLCEYYAWQNNHPYGDTYLIDRDGKICAIELKPQTLQVKIETECGAD